MKIAIPLLTVCAALSGTGCYTQLYTQGHLERAGGAYPQYAEASSSQTAGPESASADSAAGDSAAARLEGVEGDTLHRPGSVIVNNYYRESPVYRGYAISEWDYPFISFGFYGTRYRDYHGPYWWNDPWYQRRRRSGYHGGYDHGGHYNGGHSGHSGGSAGPGSSGPYKSDKRLFADPPPPKAGKGRRSAPPSESYAPPAEKSGSRESAPPRSSGGSGSASESGGSSSGSSKEESRPSKGRRR